VAFLNHYTLDECIPRTGEAYSTLIRAIKGGTLRAQKVGPVWLIHEDELDDYIRKRSKRTDKQPGKGAASEAGDRPFSLGGEAA
jgi:excisionase family DNA binding protein